MSASKVIHVADMPNYPDAVYIGRAMPRQGLKASVLANPYRIGRDGDRAEVIEKYRTHLVDLIESPSARPTMIAALVACRDKPLACWCRRDGEALTAENVCHADLIVELIAEIYEGFTAAELRQMAIAS